MDQLTQVFTSISHPSRRAILEHLSQGPLRFTDLARHFNTALNAVTKHLRLLEKAGLIERQKQGREVMISLRAEPLKEVAQWTQGYERFWNTQLDQFQRHFNEKNQNKESPHG